MLTPRLTNIDCASTTSLINDIDCTMATIAGRMYSNIVYMMNLSIPYEAMGDLLHYKRILQYKSVNPDYAKRFSVDAIASRVKLLKFKK